MPEAHVVHQAVPHSPDHEFLLRFDSLFVLYAVEGVPDGHDAVAPRLGDFGVRPAAGEQRQNFPLQRVAWQLDSKGLLTGDGLTLAADHREDPPHRIVRNAQPTFGHIQNGFHQLLRS